MLYSRVFEVYDKALGEKHLWVAAALNNRADLLRRQVGVQQRCSWDLTGATPKESPLILDEYCARTTCASLGPALGPTLTPMFFTFQGENAKAGCLQDRVLDILDATIGKKSSSYASTLGNRAIVLLAEVRVNCSVLGVLVGLDRARIESTCIAGQRLL